MVFSGSGTWGSEISSIESILTSNGASFQSVNSGQLDAMSVDDIAKYPDGNPAISEMWSSNGFVILSGVHESVLDKPILMEGQIAFSYAKV